MTPLPRSQSATRRPPSGPGGVRIIAGTFRGRLLQVPSSGVRPTSSRAREALFSRLGNLHDLRVLDLYCGSGVLGAEALSRGAAHTLFVDRNPRQLAVLTQTLEQWGVGRAHFRTLPLELPGGLRALGGERFDLILLDPPYGTGLLQQTLPLLAPLLHPDGRIAAEHPSTETLEGGDTRRYGSSCITVWEASWL